jgi:hypothetical protein
LALLGLAGQSKAAVGPKGELVLDFKGLNGKPRRWTETAPFLWIDPDSHERLAAKVVDGKVVRFSIDEISPFMVFDRVPWYANAAWLLPLLYVSLAALLLTALSWPITAVVRRSFGAKLALGPVELRAYRLSKVGAILSLATLCVWALTLTFMFKDFNNLSAKFDMNVRFAQVFGVIGFLGGFALVLWNLWTVWHGQRRWPAKLWSIVLVLSAFMLLWVAFAFNLFSFGIYY